MKLVIARHGQTEWNLHHRTQGHQDSNLTRKGQFQAELLGKALSSITFQAVYCSDLGRAVQTASRIAEANPNCRQPRLDSRLRELDYGDWEGLTDQEIIQRYPSEYWIHMNDPASFRAPSGESFSELWQRFVQFLSEIQSDRDSNTLLVTHSGIVRMALLVLTDRPLSEFRKLPRIPEASVTTAVREHGTWNVLHAGTVDHLSDAP